jgi:hypothetical protein
MAKKPITGRRLPSAEPLTEVLYVRMTARNKAALWAMASLERRSLAGMATMLLDEAVRARGAIKRGARLAAE